MALERGWSLSSGSYSSRFAPVVISAALLAARDLKEKLALAGAALLGARRVAYGESYVYDVDKPERRLDIEKIASAVHWDPGGLPEGVRGVSPRWSTFSRLSSKLPLAIG